VPLVRSGFLTGRSIYTIRKGEVVRDNIKGGLEVTPQEMVKIREHGEGLKGCVFYDPQQRACTVYSQRPAQCAALKCWDTTEFMTTYSSPKAKRKDLVTHSALLRLIEEHERRCDYGILEAHVKKIESKGERAVAGVIELLRFDLHMRSFVSQKLAIPSDEMDFLFGRPLVATIPMYGLKVIRQPDGGFLLTTDESAQRRND
jgi:Fe-S-cluster containining protein